VQLGRPERCGNVLRTGDQRAPRAGPAHPLVDIKVLKLAAVRRVPAGFMPMNKSGSMPKP
jgi:hypothetical protein